MQTCLTILFDFIKSLITRHPLSRIWINFLLFNLRKTSRIFHHELLNLKQNLILYICARFLLEFGDRVILKKKKQEKNNLPL
jgi:hypothetical protein